MRMTDVRSPTGDWAVGSPKRSTGLPKAEVGAYEGSRPVRAGSLCHHSILNGTFQLNRGIKITWLCRLMWVRAGCHCVR